MRISSCIWPVFVLISMLSCTAGKADDQLVRKLLQEWIRFFENSPQHLLRASIEVEANGESSVVTYQIKSGPRNRFLSYQDEKSAFGFNPHYAFELTRSEANGVWSIRSVQPMSTESQQLAERIREDVGRRMSAAAPRLGIQSLESVIGSASFRCSELSDDGPRGTRVIEFESIAEPGSHDFGNRRLEQRGIAHLDASSFLLPLKYHVTFNLIPLGDDSIATNGEASGTLEYDQVDGHPVLRTLEATESYQLSSGRYTTIQRVRILSSSQYSVKGSEFYLASFDLPEPRFDAKQVPAWIYWLVATIVLIGLTLVVRRLSRRKATARAC